jgi:parallel beta-helix repeat protein
MALDDIYIAEWETPAPTQLPIFPPSQAPTISESPTIVPSPSPSSLPTITSQPTILPSERPTYITETGGVDNLRRLIKSGATINLEKDIYIIESVVIYNVTAVTILGNLFKVDGRGAVRCFEIGFYEANKPGDQYFQTEVRFEKLVIANGYDSYNGGGVVIYGPRTVVTMYECVITDNSAGFNGGGIYATSSASVALTGCTFTNNVAGNLGGDVHLGVAVSFSTTGCDGDGDASSAFLDCGIDDGGADCSTSYYTYICASQAPTVLPSQPTQFPTQPSLVPTFYEPTPLPTSEPTFAGPHLNMTFCPVWPLPRPDMYNCEMRRPNFNVHNSREVGVFPTLTEGRDYFYAHPLRIFRTLEIVSESGKDIKSAFISFQDATGDGVADYTSGDYLYFYDTDNIKGTYSKGAGTLRIKGRDSPAAYEDAIREVGYRASEFDFLNLVSGGNQIPRNVSIVVNDVQGYSSEVLFREFEVIGSKRMYSENAVGRIVCTSQLCGGLGTYVFTGI